MSKKGSKTTLKVNARLRCIPKYYAMNIATLEDEIKKKDKCTLAELKSNITVKYFKLKAKEEKIKKYSTMNKDTIYKALQEKVPKNDWFDYLHQILKTQVEQKPKRKRTSTPKKPKTPKKVEIKIEPITDDTSEGPPPKTKKTTKTKKTPNKKKTPSKNNKKKTPSKKKTPTQKDSGATVQLIPPSKLTETSLLTDASIPSLHV